jgi:hypothetical protein
LSIQLLKKRQLSSHILRVIGAYNVRVKVCFANIIKPENILDIASFLDLFEGRNNTANTRRSYQGKVVFNNVSCRGFRVERIHSLQHSMLLHLVPSTKRIWSIKV